MMSDNLCPSCGEELPAEAINIAEGVALCPSCKRLSRLSEVVSGKRPLAEILSQPPAGCSVAEWGHEVIVHATLRSVSHFLGALAVALFWNGIVSVFVLIAVSGLYANLVGPLPEWFPAPEMDSSMSMGMTLFLCVFLTPFILVGLSLVGAALLAAAGKIEVLIGDSQAVVKTGVGFLVWRRRFDPTQVHRVTIGKSAWKSNDQAKELIAIEADRTIKFGTLLPDERREWLQTVLHVLLTSTDPKWRREILSTARRTDPYL